MSSNGSGGKKSYIEEIKDVTNNLEIINNCPTLFKFMTAVEKIVEGNNMSGNTIEQRCNNNLSRLRAYQSFIQDLKKIFGVPSNLQSIDEIKNNIIHKMFIYINSYNQLNQMFTYVENKYQIQSLNIDKIISLIDLLSDIVQASQPFVDFFERLEAYFPSDKTTTEGRIADMEDKFNMI